MPAVYLVFFLLVASAVKGEPLVQACLKSAVSSSFFSYLDPTFLPADISGLLTVQLMSDSSTGKFFYSAKISLSRVPYPSFIGFFAFQNSKGDYAAATAGLNNHQSSELLGLALGRRSVSATSDSVEISEAVFTAFMAVVSSAKGFRAYVGDQNKMQLAYGPLVMAQTTCQL